MLAWARLSSVAKSQNNKQANKYKIELHFESNFGKQLFNQPGLNSMNSFEERVDFIGDLTRSRRLLVNMGGNDSAKWKSTLFHM